MAPGAVRKRAITTPAVEESSKRIRSDGPTPVTVKLEVGQTSGDAAAIANDLRERFLQTLSESKFRSGITNAQLKEVFGEATYPQLVPIINTLTQENRLSMSQVQATGELSYTLLTSEQAAKFEGLDRNAKMVYSVIERAGDLGLWTKDVRLQTNIQQQALNKIFKTLEQRRLIKPVKSVTAKAKKLYMLYDLVPSKELTGGVWYSDLEFDHEFINELRQFVVHCVRRLNGGRGVTIAEVQQTLVDKKVCKIDLAVEEMEQLVETLVYDYLIEDAGLNDQGDTLFVPAKRVSTISEFKWWDVLSPDFHFRKVVFEDGVVLDPHELHYQT